MIKIGETAPDFALKDQNGRIVKLSSFKGKKVLLSFRLLAWTATCHDQMSSLENHFADFEKLNTVPLGIGVDSAPSNLAWANSMGIQKLRLLADFWPHGEVARGLGIFREKEGLAERANIILDGDRKVIFAKVYPAAQLPDIDEVLTFLKT